MAPAAIANIFQRDNLIFPEAFLVSITVSMVAYYHGKIMFRRPIEGSSLYKQVKYNLCINQEIFRNACVVSDTK